MMSSTVAFLVDGQLEQKFIQQICKGKVVRVLGCNGNSVSTLAIAKRIATLCRLFGGKYYPIVVLVDREDRRASAAIFAADILQSAMNEGVEDDLIVGVADRMIENWILTDREVVLERAKSGRRYPPSVEGLGGKGLIKKLIPNYHETTTGVELLKKCSPRLMQASPSFKAFYQQLAGLGCWWLDR